MPRRRELILVSLVIERIAHLHILEPWFKTLRVRDHADTVVGLHPEIAAALITLILLLYDARTVYHPAAFWALDKPRVLLRGLLRVL